MPGFELIGKEEQREVNDIFERGGILFRHGFDNLRNGCYKVRDFEKAFSERFENRPALAVTSCTAALRVALAALGIGRGDEVIAPSFTFVATVEAIIESGATPICTEIEETLNMDPDDLIEKITPRTKAVIAVHMLGVPARIKEIRNICREKGLYLIEDTAWGCGGSLEGRSLGTWGDIGAFSFDFAKTITTGDGGMLIFKDEVIYKKAVAWHDHGHENNPNLPRWEDSRSSSGFNFRMNELQGAVGLAQLKKLSTVVESQRKNRDIVANAIKDISNIKLRVMPGGSYDTADAFVFFVESPQTAQNCRKALLEVGLATKILPEAYTWHFAGTWTHMPELVNSHGGKLESAFPRSEELLKRSVSIPIIVKMDPSNAAKIKDALKKVL
jgi:8-amino-3,8-dideoxy-alpha-D-manno-octulosonate transaminase